MRRDTAPPSNTAAGIFAMDLIVDFDYAGNYLLSIRVHQFGIPHAR
ncbi:MAG: hypothetical protein QNJ48_04900 [Desulfobacterales bacterium]|nr:hypothetical protein [Desulfobacterales bacterium]MDJ0874461.1 hypothetical protein [Desulfobacterales bacterium]MDJ0883472.1 hypothetical protein [Desulfobacterales bacterium]